MVKSFSGFLKIFFPLFPELKSGKNNFHKALSILGILIFSLGVLGSVSLIFPNIDGDYFFSLLVILFLVSIIIISLNIFSFIYYFIGMKFFSKKIVLKQNNYKNYFIFSLFIISSFILFYFINTNTYTYVSRQQNYNRFYYDSSQIYLTGDWDDSKLADEVRKHEITCREYTGECEWLIASVQEWNDNYFTVESTTFEIDEWGTNKVHAILNSENRTEEITFYLDTCKMVYVKTPTSNNAEDSLIGSSPDDVLLTMTDDYCYSSRN